MANPSIQPSSHPSSTTPITSEMKAAAIKILSILSSKASVICISIHKKFKKKRVNNGGKNRFKII